MVDGVRYADVRDALTADGSWRDLYVFETDANEWLQLVRAVMESGWSWTLTRDGEPTSSAAEAIAFSFSGSGTTLLSVRVGALRVNSHFFGPEEIEFDLDPSELTEASFESLCGFMGFIGELLGKNVFLTEENHPQCGIMAFEVERSDFLVLKRPPDPTALSSSLRDRLRHILRPFVNGVRAHKNDVPSSDVAQAAVHEWREQLYRPGQMKWHTELTQQEFSSLRDLDNAFAIFFGATTAVALCKRGGFTMHSLRRQFWESVERARGTFALPTE